MSRLPALDEIEHRPDSPQARPSFRDNREPSTKRLPPHCGGCWCGEPFPHRWPGKDAGAPHPREATAATAETRSAA